jgi:capsular exopolysaccharide synthesis family protein
MIGPGTGEQKADAVDIKEYLSVVLKRKWLVLICFLLSMAASTAFLFTRQSIWRANCKLLITSAGGALPSAEISRESDSSFFSTQIEIMSSPTMLRRVQQRMKKTPDEIRENLTKLKISMIRGTQIMLIAVDSSSRDFARDFANALAEEFFRFREEQRAATSESALLMLTREINRLSQELKGANDKLLNYAKEHNMAMADRQEQVYQWKYWQVLSNLGRATVDLAEAKTRKQLMDARSDTATVLALLAAQGEPAAGPGAAKTPGASPATQNPFENQPLATGTEVTIAVDKDSSLNRTVKLDAAGSFEFPPLGRIQAGGRTPAELRTLLQDRLQKEFYLSAKVEISSSAAAPPAAVEAQPDSPAGTVQPAAGSSPDTRGMPTVGSSTTPTMLGIVSDAHGQRLFEYESQRRLLQARLVELHKLYRPKHPALAETERQLQNLSEKADAEIQFVREKVDANYQLAKQRYEQMKSAADQIDAEALGDGQRMLEIKSMRANVERVQTLYNTLLGKLMQIDVTQGFNTRTISVLEAALLEQNPIYPQKAKGLLIAAFFGIGLGLALAFFIEYIDDSIKLAEEVERELQLPFLGMIPAAQWNPDDLSAHRLDRLKQQGGVAEAYRVVRSAILFSTPREKLRSILVTSAVPREGKTTTTVNLAIGFSQVEDRVLLIDGDLRRGEIHKFFGFEKDKGLADVLLGEATPEEVVKRTDVPKLDIITVGSYPANPAELLLGWRLKELMDWALPRYSRVIVDCTPVMGIADSAILGAAVDGVLFVIWAGRTSRRYVRVAKTTAVSRGAKIFGFVLNNLEPGRVGYYHYYPYYYSYYSHGYYYARTEEDKGKGGDIKGIEVPTKESGKDDIDDVY